MEAIGREKAGIFRRDRPAVFGSAAMPQSIEQSVAEVGARLLRLGRDFGYRRHGDRWSWHGTKTRHDDLPRPALVGEIQFDNAASVLAVLESLAERLPVTRDAIVSGLQRVSLPGRFQTVQGRAEWILDVAHNPAAAHTLASQLAERGTSGRTIAVCGMLGDKDIEGVADELRGRFDEWLLCGLSGPRAVDVNLLARRLGARGANVTAQAPDVSAACVLADTKARAGDRIVVFGSFLTVGPALTWLRSQGLAAA